MPLPLIKNQYPGQEAAPGRIGALAADETGTIRAKSGIIDTVTHQSAGTYVVTTTEPLSGGPVDNPISGNVSYGTVNQPFIIHFYPVGTQQIYVYTYSLIKGTWTLTDLRFTMEIGSAPPTV